MTAHLHEWADDWLVTYLAAVAGAEAQLLKDGLNFDHISLVEFVRLVAVAQEAHDDGVTNAVATAAHHVLNRDPIEGERTVRQIQEIAELILQRSIRPPSPWPRNVPEEPSPQPTLTPRQRAGLDLGVALGKIFAEAGEKGVDDPEYLTAGLDAAMAEAKTASLEVAGGVLVKGPPIPPAPEPALSGLLHPEPQPGTVVPIEPDAEPDQSRRYNYDPQPDLAENSIERAERMAATAGLARTEPLSPLGKGAARAAMAVKAAQVAEPMPSADDFAPDLAEPDPDNPQTAPITGTKLAEPGSERRVVQAGGEEIPATDPSHGPYDHGAEPMTAPEPEPERTARDSRPVQAEHEHGDEEAWPARSHPIGGTTRQDRSSIKDRTERASRILDGDDPDDA